MIALRYSCFIHYTTDSFCFQSRKSTKSLTKFSHRKIRVFPMAFSVIGMINRHVLFAKSGLESRFQATQKPYWMIPFGGDTGADVVVNGLRVIVLS